MNYSVNDFGTTGCSLQKDITPKQIPDESKHLKNIRSKTKQQKAWKNIRVGKSFSKYNKKARSYKRPTNSDIQKQFSYFKKSTNSNVKRITVGFSFHLG